MKQIKPRRAVHTNYTTKTILTKEEWEQLPEDEQLQYSYDSYKKTYHRYDLFISVMETINDLRQIGIPKKKHYIDYNINLDTDLNEFLCYNYFFTIETDIRNNQIITAFVKLKDIILLILEEHKKEHLFGTEIKKICDTIERIFKTTFSV